MKKYPNESPDFDLERILPPLKKLVDENQAVYVINNGDVSLRLNKLHITDDVVTMLFQYADKKATDPTFTRIADGKTRTVQKEEGEGVSVSAHLVINRKPQNTALKIFHHALLEEVPGITKRLLAKGLTHMLAECAKSSYRRDGIKKDFKCRPMVSLEFNGNEKLSDLLSKGSITGLVAFRDVVANKMDEDAEFKVKDERMTLVTLRKRGKAALDTIEKAKDWIGDRKYTRLQIRYEGDNKRKQTLEVGVREQDISEKMFAKSSFVSVDEAIAQCQETIHPKLHNKMLTKLDDMVKSDVR
ncbi:hypothetical protein VXM60_02270 [Shewanella khirikhana]|uniref:hypothetical protein n=1 Tax=Shewanella khirikhana TaxID=1965282 RepID=UPI0030D379C5